MEKLTTNYNVKFTDVKSLDFKRANDIYDRCVELKWSRKEFRKRLNEFLDSHKWFNFTRADFLACERKQLYPRSWYLEQVAKNSSAEFEAYYVPTDNGEIIMYRFRSERRIEGLKFVEAFEPKSKTITDNSRQLEESSIDREANKKILDDALKKFYNRTSVKPNSDEQQTTSSDSEPIEIQSKPLDSETVQKQLKIIQEKYGTYSEN